MIKKFIATIKNYRYLFLLYLLVAFLLIANALFEMQQSKKELLELMKNQSEAMLHSVIMSSENLIKNNFQTQDIIEHHLARMLQLFDVLAGKVNDDLINHILKEANLDGLFFIDSTYTPFLIAGQFKELPPSRLNDLFDKALELRTISGDTLFWQESLAIGEDTLRYRVGCRFLPDGKILMLMGKSVMETTSATQADFGTLIRDLAAQVPNIIFLALQDSSGIIAAAGQLKFLNQPIRQTTLQSGQPAFKILDFDSTRIFEAEHPFFYQGKNIGMFRLGLSTEALDRINQRIYRRLMVLSLILIGIALLILTFAFVRQRYDILHRQYQVIETYSSNIIENVSDAIIVFDLVKGIKIFNRSAERLFNKKRDMVLGQSLEQCGCPSILTKPSSVADQVQEIEIKTGNEVKSVLVSSSSFKDSDGQVNRIFVLRDITRQKQLEEHMKRQEQLTAIGQLAAGVAHEIRNPLNSISTIIQQLKRDFKPVEDYDLYNQLTEIVYNEVKRINQKINEFLRFSRPEPVRPSLFILSEWLQSIVTQYRPTFKERNIEFKLTTHWDGEVFWDANQMRDVLSNLIQNALDAMPNGGQLTLMVQKENGKIALIVQDNGPGIPPELKDKVFNLYFTTKASGTGIGLSLVQRIVFEHDGFIQLESEPGQGTTFKVLLPQEISPR